MATFTNLPVTRSIINHNKNLKPRIYMKHISLQNVTQLSAPSQKSLDEQTHPENFPFSVFTLLTLFVVFSSFQILFSPRFGTGYNSFFQAPSNYSVDSTTWCKFTCTGGHHIFPVVQ